MTEGQSKITQIRKLDGFVAVNGLSNGGSYISPQVFDNLKTTMQTNPRADWYGIATITEILAPAKLRDPPPEIHTQ